MRFRTPALAAALATLAILPATASAAAPDREGALAAIGDKFTWSTDELTGFVYTSDVSDRAPACSPIFSCDATLIKTSELGDLQVDIAGKGVQGQDTLKDVDLHVYESDASGAPGEVLAESTGATATEAVLVEDAAPGYYLVYVDWYLGAGSVDGTAQLVQPIDEEAL